MGNIENANVSMCDKRIIKGVKVAALCSFVVLQILKYLCIERFVLI